MDKMTLEQYIVNPMGKNNAVMSAPLRETIKRDYTMRFHNVLLRENGKIEYKIFKISAKNEFLIHVKIPSEVVSEFYYDVVYKFNADENVKDNGKNMEKWYIQFYSNDPAFVFTYANVFMQNGMFVNELSSKMSKEAIKNQPKERNPDNLKGYVKSIYFAYIFLKERGLLKKVRLDSAPELDLKLFLSTIVDADTKIAQRQIEGKKISTKKKIRVDKNTLRRMERYTNSDLSSKVVVTTNKAKSIKTLAKKKSQNITTTKTTKRK